MFGCSSSLDWYDLYLRVVELDAASFIIPLYSLLITEGLKVNRDKGLGSDIMNGTVWNY